MLKQRTLKKRLAQISKSLRQTPEAKVRLDAALDAVDSVIRSVGESKLKARAVSRAAEELTSGG